MKNLTEFDYCSSFPEWMSFFLSFIMNVILLLIQQILTAIFYTSNISQWPICLWISYAGKRQFQKRLFCNWTGGYKWSTALALRWEFGPAPKLKRKRAVHFFLFLCPSNVLTPAFSPQHHSGWLRSWPVLSGPVERRSGQTVQLRRPGHLDSDRRSPYRGWLRGACWRVPLHLRRRSGRHAWVMLTLPLCTAVCLAEPGTQHILITSARQEEFS